MTPDLQAVTDRRIGEAPVFVGIDVCKATLDVHLRPGGATFAVARTPRGLDALVERLALHAPQLVILEATGGFEIMVISGIVYVIRHGLQWKDAPTGYGPPKTLHNRFIRWSRLGVFARIFGALAAKGGAPARLMIDATHLKAHRTAASLLQKGVLAVSAAPRAG